MIKILFDKHISHFIASVQACGRNICLINCHLSVLDGHKSHGRINVVHKTKGLGLNLITLPLLTNL
jgi:hypothetical protein